MIQFMLNSGLVATGIIDKFSVTYWVITAIAIAFQLVMVAMLVRLNRQHFGRVETSALAAE